MIAPAPRAPAARAAVAAAAALALAASCGSAPPPRGSSPKLVRRAPAARAPRLVVLIVVDQLPAWSFARKRPALTAGFDRLLREGEWHTGEYPSAATITAPGHALIATGEPPATSGILSNEWYRRAQDKILRSVEDPDAAGASSSGAPSTSSRWLRVPGIADAMAAAAAAKRGKAVSVSLKDRAAILVLGRAGLPIWYDRKAVAWTTIASPPPWLAEHNRRAPIAAHLKDRWTADDPRRLAELSGTTDDQPGEVGERGFGPTFPHDPVATKDPAFALFAAPVSNQLIFEAGLAAIEGEALGQDAVPDLLALSLSAHDYVGHGWGHESWEAWDMLLRTDDQLGRFLEALDARVGPGRWAMLVTSDHGAGPLPERVGGGRITYESIRDAANRAASTALGLGDWIADVKYPSIYLSAAARARPARDQQRAIAKILYALRAYPGIARAERTVDVAGRCGDRTGDARMICLALDPAESGEVFYMPARGWLVHERVEPVAASHGSLYEHDREVPLLLIPPGRAPHAPLTAPASPRLPMARVSSILAQWLGVPAPQTLPR